MVAASGVAAAAAAVAVVFASWVVVVAVVVAVVFAADASWDVFHVVVGSLAFHLASYLAAAAAAESYPSSFEDPPFCGQEPQNELHPASYVGLDDSCCEPYLDHRGLHVHDHDLACICLVSYYLLETRQSSFCLLHSDLKHVKGMYTLFNIISVDQCEIIDSLFLINRLSVDVQGKV